jgi:hypothetical protein
MSVALTNTEFGNGLEMVNLELSDNRLVSVKLLVDENFFVDTKV